MTIFRKKHNPQVYSDMDYLRDYGVPPEVTDTMSDEQIMEAATALREALKVTDDPISLRWDRA